MKNPEAVKKWVEALRSGEFKQAKGVLYDREHGSYCCLGVACFLAKKEGVIPKQARWSIPAGCDTEPALNLVDQFAPVKEWLGLREAEGAFGAKIDQKGLARMNDNGCTFEEIADLIESNPEGLFE